MQRDSNEKAGWEGGRGEEEGRREEGEQREDWREREERGNGGREC